MRQSLRCDPGCIKSWDERHVGLTNLGLPMDVTIDRRPDAQDVIIYKLDALTYHLWLGTRPCGQFHQWYRVFDEGMRLARGRGVALWIREAGVDTLLRHRAEAADRVTV